MYRYASACKCHAHLTYPKECGRLLTVVCGPYLYNPAPAKETTCCWLLQPLGSFAYPLQGLASLLPCCIPQYGALHGFFYSRLSNEMGDPTLATPESWELWTGAATNKSGKNVPQCQAQIQHAACTGTCILSMHILLHVGHQ